MNSLPMELRRRIVEAYERKEGTYFELAQRFGVGEATVYRLLRLKRERGNLSPGAPTGVSEHELQEFVQLANEFPHATLDQLKEAWTTRTGRQLSRSSIVRALQRAGITREKASRRRAETVPTESAAAREQKARSESAEQACNREGKPK